MKTSGIRRNEHRQHHAGCMWQRMGLRCTVGACANQDFSAKDVTEMLSRPKNGTAVVPNGVQRCLSSQGLHVFAFIYFATQISSKTLGSFLPFWAASPEFFLWLCASNNLLSFEIKWTESRVCVHPAFIEIISIFSKH